MTNLFADTDIECTIETLRSPDYPSGLASSNYESRGLPRLLFCQDENASRHAGGMKDRA